MGVDLPLWGLKLRFWGGGFRESTLAGRLVDRVRRKEDGSSVVSRRLSLDDDRPNFFLKSLRGSGEAVTVR